MADNPLFLPNSFDRVQAQDVALKCSQFYNVPIAWENSIGVQFQLIPPARYLQGITEAERIRLDATENSMPQHEVVLTNPWYCGTLPITLGQFQMVCGFDPSTSEKATTEPHRFPVTSVSWFDAIRFCIKLSEAESLTPCYAISNETYYNEELNWNMCNADVKFLNGCGYRLPTEAEWEFVAKAGTDRNFVDPEEREMAAEEQDWRHRLPLDRRPNPLGVCETAGLYQEWCLDAWRFGYDHFPALAFDPVKFDIDDPLDPARILRGRNVAFVSARTPDNPGNNGEGRTFRICNSIPTQNNGDKKLEQLQT